MELIYDYHSDLALRRQFFDFVPQVFGTLNFEFWDKIGGWTPAYKPCSFTDGDRLLANVSFSHLEILIDGQALRGIQFATVGTLPECRGQGLSRKLMEHVLDLHADTTDLFFLYANETVLDFYPKFGFRRVHECYFRAAVPSLLLVPTARQLDIRQAADLALLKGLCYDRLPVTRRFGCTDYGPIMLWRLLSDYAAHLWYLDEQEVLFIAQEADGQLDVYDILSRKPFNFHGLLPFLLRDGATHTIRAHFSPDLLGLSFAPGEAYTYSPLFVRGDFPLESGTFKFPVMAET
ncbi:MAG: GNAT family N-acetyltransferase [Bacteroidota bacterium]